MQTDMTSWSTCEALGEMTNAEILEAIREIESSYRDHPSSVEGDHRQHLHREELENIFRLACRIVELRT